MVNTDASNPLERLSRGRIRTAASVHIVCGYRWATMALIADFRVAGLAALPSFSGPITSRSGAVPCAFPIAPSKQPAFELFVVKLTERANRACESAGRS